MNKFRTSPFGTWETPITSSVVSSSGVQIKEISVDDGHVYWLEGRPDEGGRNVLVTRACNGALADVTPKGFNVRNSVHEYGGGSYVIHRGVVYFCNWDDQRIYRQCMGEAPVPITPAPQIPFEDRYADLGVTPNGLFLTCVRERHVEGSETVNEVVSVSTNGLSDVKVVASREPRGVSRIPASRSSIGPSRRTLGQLQVSPELSDRINSTLPKGQM